MSPITPPPSAMNVTLRSRASSRHLSRISCITSIVLLASPSGRTRVSVVVVVVVEIVKKSNGYGMV